MFDFTLKYFFKEIKKNISMIGVITGAMLLLSLILSMFYNSAYKILNIFYTIKTFPSHIFL